MAVAHPADRTMPHDLDAEMAALGAVIQDAEISLPKLAVELKLQGRHFYRENNGAVYEAAVALWTKGEPVDSVTLSAELERRGILERVGGRAGLLVLAESSPTAVNAGHYGEIVLEKWKRRQGIDAARKIATLMYDPQVETTDALGQGMEAMFSATVGTLRSDFQPMPDLLAGAMNRMLSEEEVRAVKTGFPKLDEMLGGGFKPEELGIIAARPGVGKTSIGMCIGLTAAEHGVGVGVFSLEMSAGQLIDRLIAVESKVPSRRFRKWNSMSEDERQRVDRAVNKLSELPIWIDDDPALDEMSLMSKARLLKARHENGPQPLGLVILDYLQLMPGRGNNREQEVRGIADSLKRLARELKVPVLAMAQLNREAEKRGDKRPILADLRESGAIEQSADVVLMIYREDYHSQEATVGQAELLIRKQRNGPVGAVKVGFRDDLTWFYPTTGDEYEEEVAY